MERFLYRVQYTYPDASVSYEPVCVRAADDDTTSALAEVLVATARYAAASKATRTYTLLGVAADV